MPPLATHGPAGFGRDAGGPLTELFGRVTRKLSPNGAQ
ncbi:hypothetical protein SAMN05216267_106829 [Actinacidiphila rubida]|uniref:Uncharacterized protein n=1 Tax=Actinacidiphila rubida TaxID=310780 RepID=A0A1H8UBW4_9ACTN|nr:hypothetical protein SAMN05216267_103371 [Actinacidiphila rubida]SEP00586.1 hypothetical protein SAMN05216267_106829 [Actinacidiphila rubida]